MIHFICVFSWCQVEEEASDKDNKNCSNNGEQRACFDILYFVLNTKQQYCLRHTKHSTMKAPVQRVRGWILSRANHEDICIQMWY